MTTHKIEILITGRDKASGPISGVKGALGGIGVVAGGILAAGVFTGIAEGFMKMAAGSVQFIKDSVGSAARVEEMAAVLKTLENNQGLAVGTTDQMVASIKELGITTQSAQWVTAQFTRWQLNAADATSLARLAQDAAVISMQDSSDALKGLMHGITTMNTRVLRTYGITLASTVSAQDEYAESLGKTRGELNETEKIQAVLNAVLGQGAQISGAYEAAMDTAGKKARSMKRHVVELMNAVGAPFLGAFGAAVDIVTDFIKGLGSIAQEGGPLNDFLLALGGVVDELFASLDTGAGLETFTDTITNVLTPITDFLERLKTFLQLVRIFGPESASAALGLEELVGPKIAGFIMNLVKVFGNVKTAVTGFLDTLSTTAGPIVDQFMATFIRIKDWFVANWPIIQAAFLTAWELIKANVMTAIEILRPPIEALIEAFRNLFTPERIQAWGEMLGIVLAVAGALLQGIIAIAVGVVSGIIQAFTHLVTAFGGIFDGIKLFIDGVRQIFEGDLKGGLSTILDGIKLILTSAFQGMVDAAIALVGGMVTSIIDFINGLIEKLTGKKSDFLSAGRDLVQGLWDGAKNVAERLKTWFSNLIGGLVDKAKDLLGLGSKSKLFAQFGEWVMEGLGEGIKIGAKGPQLAMATVAPGLMGAAAGGMGGRGPGAGGPTYVNIEVNGARDPKAVVNEIMRQLRRQGITLGQ